MKSCKTCGSSFAATGPNHRYCSPACRPSTPPATAPDGRRTCAACGTPFTRTSLAQRYCSQSCRPSEQPAYPQRKYIERVGRPLVAKRGAPPDLAKRARVAELRAAGWTLKRIGAEMGVSEPAVSLMLKAIRDAEAPSPAAG